MENNSLSTHVGKWEEGRMVELRAWAKEDEYLMNNSCGGGKDERFVLIEKVTQEAEECG